MKCCSPTSLWYVMVCYYVISGYYIIIISLYHHCIIIGLQSADSRKDSWPRGPSGRLTCVNNKYRLFFWGGGFTPGRLQYIPIAIQLYHHTTTGVYIFSRQLWRQPYCTGRVGVLVRGQGWTLINYENWKWKWKLMHKNLC